MTKYNVLLIGSVEVEVDIDLLPGEDLWTVAEEVALDNIRSGNFDFDVEYVDPVK